MAFKTVLGVLSSFAEQTVCLVVIFRQSTLSQRLQDNELNGPARSSNLTAALVLQLAACCTLGPEVYVRWDYSAVPCLI